WPHSSKAPNATKRMRFKTCPRDVPAPALERRTGGKLESLDAIIRLRAERERIAELERAERRVPGHAQTPGIAEVLRARVGLVLCLGIVGCPDLAGVEEQARADRLVALQ